MFQKVKNNSRYRYTAEADLAGAPNRVLVFRDGWTNFKWMSGRKVKTMLDADAAKSVIGNFHSLGRDIIFDFEHQSEGGEFARPAGDGLVPAAGWIHGFEYVPGQGLYANVKWNDEASELLKKRAYRYFSPVWIQDKNTNRVTEVVSVALTNNPAQLALEPIIASGKGPHGAMKMETVLNLLGISPAEIEGKSDEEAWSIIGEKLKTALGQQNEQMQAVAKALGTEFEPAKIVGAKDANTKLIARATEVAKSATDAKASGDAALKTIATELGCDADQAKIVAKVKEIKNVKPGEIDPTKFVAKEQYDAVTTRLDSLESDNKKLQASITQAAKEKFIKSGMDAGKIVATTKDYWSNLFDANAETAEKLLASAPVTGPTSKTVTDDKSGKAEGDGGAGDAADRKTIIASATAEHPEAGMGVNLHDWIDEALREKKQPGLTKAEKESIAA